MKRDISMADLDPFSRERFPEIGKRLQAIRAQHYEQESTLWAGMLARVFDDQELGILEAMGMLSEHDHRWLAAIGRHAQAVPIPDTQNTQETNADA